jgi:protein-disulfide isomerase
MSIRFLLAAIAAQLLYLGAAQADPQGVGSAAVQGVDEEYARLMAIASQNRAPAKRQGGTLDISNHPTRGSATAPLVMMEFGSFQCPYCRRHLFETYPDIEAKYIDTGKLLYVFYDFSLDPKHRHARHAAEAAHCAAEQGKYWEFRNRLYRNQKALAPMFIEAHAQAVDLEMPPFRECLKSARYRDRPSADRDLARKLRVRGTPTFFLGIPDKGGREISIVRRISGSRPFDLFARQIDALEEQHTLLGLN